MASETSTNGRLSEALKTIHTEVDRIAAFLDASRNEVQIIREAPTSDRDKLRAGEIPSVPSERLIGVLSELGTRMNTRDFSREEVVAAFKITIGME